MKAYLYFLLFLLLGLTASENIPQQTVLITSRVDCIVPAEVVTQIDSVMENKVIVTPIVQLR